MIKMYKDVQCEDCVEYEARTAYEGMCNVKNSKERYYNAVDHCNHFKCRNLSIKENCNSCKNKDLCYD